MLAGVFRPFKSDREVRIEGAQFLIEGFMYRILRHSKFPLVQPPPGICKSCNDLGFEIVDNALTVKGKRGTDAMALWW